MQKGTIQRLVADRGFGFIKTEREEDLFFGRNQLQGVDYGSLREGQEVEFEVTRDPNGHLHAIRVRLAQPEGGWQQARPGDSLTLTGFLYEPTSSQPGLGSTKAPRGFPLAWPLSSNRY